MLFVAGAVYFGGLGTKSFAQEPPNRRGSYSLAIASDTTMTMVNGSQQRVQSLMEIDYSWHHHGSAREMTLDRLLMKTTINGKVDEHMEMSATAMTKYVNGEPKPLSIEKAPPELKTMLQEMFGGPLYRLDQRENEMITTILAKGAGKEMMDEGSIGQTSLFHPVIPGRKDEWESNAAMVLGSEGVVRGKLSYRRIPERKGAVYAVQGTLANDRYPNPGGKTVMSGVRYVVNGEETYDETAQLWLEGKLNVSVSYEIQFGTGAKAGDGKGTIVATMKRR